MAVVDVTLDSIIRRNLAKRKLPLHYYSPLLVIAKEGLDEMHFDSLQKLKFVTIAIDATLKTGPLPSDYVEAVAVGFESGDKVRPVGHNHRLNERNSGAAFEQKDPLYALGTGFYVGGFLLENAFNEYLGYKGREFGRPVTFTDAYTILREAGLIRIDNISTITTIQLVYLSLPEKVSNKSVIHPFAKKSLDTYIDWQWSVYNKEKDQEMRRRDFYNNYRGLRSRLNKMTTVEIKRIVRNKFGLDIKN